MSCGSPARVCPRWEPERLAGMDQGAAAGGARGRGFQLAGGRATFGEDWSDICERAEVRGELPAGSCKVDRPTSHDLK